MTTSQSDYEIKQDAYFTNKYSAKIAVSPLNKQDANFYTMYSKKSIFANEPSQNKL
jgi:hypothetical protein